MTEIKGQHPLVIPLIAVLYWLHNIAYHSAAGTYSACPCHGADAYEEA